MVLSLKTNSWEAAWMKILPMMMDGLHGRNPLSSKSLKVDYVRTGDDSTIVKSLTTGTVPYTVPYHSSRLLYGVLARVLPTQ